MLCRLHENFLYLVGHFDQRSWGTPSDISAFRRSFYSFLHILPLDIMSDDPGAPRQTFLKIVGHVRRDRRISGSLVVLGNRLTFHLICYMLFQVCQDSIPDVHVMYCSCNTSIQMLCVLDLSCVSFCIWAASHKNIPFKISLLLSYQIKAWLSPAWPNLYLVQHWP